MRARFALLTVNCPSSTSDPPTIFHLVLAGWLLLYGHLHWTLGLHTRSTR